MNLKGIAPLVLYDDQCMLCTKFAASIGRMGCGKITLVGHYSPLGKRIRSALLSSDALEMFWFIDERTAYGGRAALLPLLRTLLLPRRGTGHLQVPEMCGTGCRTAGAVFVRSASLLSRSRKIRLSAASNL